jgi:mannose/cellobiose epimerase-like protein (N-acyl-D-glucosamine 2-epimerase family)
MNEEDLRDCFAMFALAGAMMAPEKRYNAKTIWQVADDMMEARKHKEKEDEEDAGIAAVVPKRTRKR